LDVKTLDPLSTSGRNANIYCKTQTETKIRQWFCANSDGQEPVRRLKDKNRQLSILVEKYERKFVVLNEEMEQNLQVRTSQMYHITIRYEEENQRQLLKMRDMSGELLWYKASVYQHGLMGMYIHYCLCLNLDHLL
jgi:hypothetical protein